MESVTKITPLILQLLLNAEGTRFTEKKHEASNQFARERGIPELKHHLIPRSKGFVTSLPYLKKKCPCILDIQLVFKPTDKVEPTLGNLVHGHGVTGYMHVRRIDINTVPSTEEGAAEWMQELFREKDKLHDSFLTHGDFFTGSGMKPVEPFTFPPSRSALFNTVFWLAATLTPMLYYLVGLLFSGEILSFSVGVGIIAICEYSDSPPSCCRIDLTCHSLFSVYALMQKTIGMTKISKGSSYGSSEKPTKTS